MELTSKALSNAISGSNVPACIKSSSSLHKKILGLQISVETSIWRAKALESIQIYS